MKRKCRKFTKHGLKRILVKVLNDFAHIPRSAYTEESLIAEDLNIDSLKYIELLGAIEDTLGIDFDNDELLEVKTVGDFVYLCERKIV